MAPVAGALLLLICATQAYRGASMVMSAPARFRTRHLLMASFNPTLAKYTPDQAKGFYKLLLERARNIPGVKSAALAQAAPLMPGGGASRLVPEGVKLPPGTKAVGLMSNTVSEGYFDTLHVPIVKGRAFEVSDRAESRPAAIVNEMFARKYYPNQTIGKRLRVKGAKDDVLEIVGVAALIYNASRLCAATHVLTRGSGWGRTNSDGTLVSSRKPPLIRNRPGG